MNEQHLPFVREKINCLSHGTKESISITPTYHVKFSPEAQCFQERNRQLIFLSLVYIFRRRK